VAGKVPIKGADIVAIGSFDGVDIEAFFEFRFDWDVVICGFGIEMVTLVVSFVGVDVCEIGVDIVVEVTVCEVGDSAATSVKVSDVGVGIEVNVCGESGVIEIEFFEGRVKFESDNRRGVFLAVNVLVGNRMFVRGNNFRGGCFNFGALFLCK